MTDIIDLADRRNPGINLGLFNMVAAALELDPDVVADFRPRLALLDCEVCAGNPIAARYWRLARVALIDAIPVVSRESAMDSLTLIAAILFHWSNRHAFEERERRMPDNPNEGRQPDAVDGCPDQTQRGVLKLKRIVT
jgi:hypothetical protein